MTRIAEIFPAHHAQILKLNRDFVHWLSPLDEMGLDYILSHAEYARKIDGGVGILIGYAHDVDYPKHANLRWLKTRINNFFYIDRIIIDLSAHGTGLGQLLYADIEDFARSRGHDFLACEVNIIPNNPSSHRFHLKAGFEALGEQVFTDEKAVRYYAKALKPS